MRNVALDLGATSISYCEVRAGAVIGRMTVGKLENLMSVLGPDSRTARVAIEACREAWHVHDTLMGWGHKPVIVDTTRTRQIGVGQHRRKNDQLDAEVLARAMERNDLPAAHVLSPARRELRTATASESTFEHADVLARAARKLEAAKSETRRLARRRAHDLLEVTTGR